MAKERANGPWRAAVVAATATSSLAVQERPRQQLQGVMRPLIATGSKAVVVYSVVALRASSRMAATPRPRRVRPTQEVRAHATPVRPDPVSTTAELLPFRLGVNSG